MDDLLGFLMSLSIGFVGVRCVVRIGCFCRVPVLILLGLGFGFSGFRVFCVFQRIPALGWLGLRIPEDAFLGGVRG